MKVTDAIFGIIFIVYGYCIGHCNTVGNTNELAGLAIFGIVLLIMFEAYHGLER